MLIEDACLTSGSRLFHNVGAQNVKNIKWKKNQPEMFLLRYAICLNQPPHRQFIPAGCLLDGHLTDWTVIYSSVKQNKHIFKTTVYISFFPSLITKIAVHTYANYYFILNFIST